MSLLKNVFFVIRIYFLFLLKKLEIAKQLCLKQIEFSKQPTRLYHALLGDILKRLGQTKLAIAEYKFALKESKPHPVDYHNLISLSFKVGKYEEVIQLSQRFLEERFSFIQNKLVKFYIGGIFWYLAQSAARLQRYELSISYFEKYLPFSKTDRKDVYETLGYCYEKLGQYEKAVANYSKALSIDPSLSVSRENLEQIYKEKPFLKK